MAFTAMCLREGEDCLYVRTVLIVLRVQCDLGSFVKNVFRNAVLCFNDTMRLLTTDVHSRSHRGVLPRWKVPVP